MNRKVFAWRRKAKSVGARRISLGRVFQSWGATTEKALFRHAIPFTSFRDGTFRRASWPDLRGWAGSYGRRRSFRYITTWITKCSYRSPCNLFPCFQVRLSLVKMEEQQESGSVFRGRKQKVRRYQIINLENIRGAKQLAINLPIGCHFTKSKVWKPGLMRNK